MLDERFVTKAEIDTKIQVLHEKREGLLANRVGLQDGLAGLLHSYEAAGDDLDKFKEAKEALEDRIEKPTLPDKLAESFRTLLGKEPREDKSDFLEGRSRTSVSRGYRNTGEQLRNSVSTVAENKDIMRELMGEDLSFRGGKMKGEEKVPREQSIEKITKTILEINGEIDQTDGEVKQKRGEVYEAWKKENPEQLAEIQKKDRATAAFEELIISNPTKEELREIFLRTEHLDIKDKARLLLLEKVRKESPDKFFIALVYGGLYSSENFDELVSTFKRLNSSDMPWCNFALFNLAAVDERLEEFAISNINVHEGCRWAGNSENCERDGCLMAIRYTELPMSVQEKIVKKLKNDGAKKDIIELFPRVEMAKIKDPLEKAKFILNLPIVAGRYKAYSPSYSLNDSSELTKAANDYMTSGEQDPKLLLRAVALTTENKAVEKIFVNITDEQITNGLFAKIVYKIFLASSDINADVIKRYAGKYTLKTNTERERREEADRYIYQISNILGCAGSHLENVVQGILKEHFNNEIEQIYQKEQKRKNIIKEIL